MNSVVSVKPQKTMSSREIAKIVNSRHSDVVRTLSKLSEKGVIQGYTPAAYTHEQNRQEYFEYFINERDSYVVVAQLSPEFTAKLVDWWHELEQQNQMAALPDFTNPAEAARAWAEQVEQKMVAQQLLEDRQIVIEVQKPKVEFYDNVTQTANEYSVKEAAKILKTGEKRLFRYLKENAYIDAGRHPYQRWLDQKLFSVKWQKNNKSTGPETYPRTFITGKGLGRLARELLLDQLNTETVNAPVRYQGEFSHV